MIGVINICRIINGVGCNVFFYYVCSSKVVWWVNVVWSVFFVFIYCIEVYICGGNI